MLSLVLRVWSEKGDDLAVEIHPDGARFHRNP
jgi:hypothetical protein